MHDQISLSPSSTVQVANWSAIHFIFRVAALLEAKGGGRKGRFQGKATKIERRNEVSELLKKECSEHND